MKFGRAVIILLVLLGSVGCDQVTKVVAREHLDGRGTLSYLGDTIRLTYIENHGAFLGLGASMPEFARTLVFTVVVAAFLAGFAIWIFRTSVISTSALVASTLVIGGGLGNLIDRILFDGGVTDFLNIGIGSLRTGIFNVADVWIMAGVFLLVLSPEMRRGFEEPPDEDSSEPA